VKTSEKLLWKVVIDKGLACKQTEWNKYIGYNTSIELTEEMQGLAYTVGVDWDKMTSVSEQYHDMFEGTFSQDTTICSYEGELELLDGSSYFVLLDREDVSLVDMVEMICKVQDEDLIK